MIVKWLKKTGGGSARATVDYMLGKNRDRADATVLRGNPDMIAALADSLQHKHTYAVGVLSFEEAPDQISEAAKADIIDSFEHSIFAGLQREQYGICWIEHRDKGRLELNFIIPKVDLRSGKAMNPYLHAKDERYINAWKDLVNIKHGLTEPNDPAKRHGTTHRQRLPQAKKDLSAAIDASVSEQIAQGNISDRNSVIQHLESMGLEITKTAKKSVSVKHGEMKQPLRLTGEYYEQSFNAQQMTPAAKADASKRYQESKQQRYNEAFETYKQCFGSRKKYNASRYAPPPPPPPAPPPPAEQPHHDQVLRSFQETFARIRDAATRTIQRIRDIVGTAAAADRTIDGTDQRIDDIKRSIEQRKRAAATTHSAAGAGQQHTATATDSAAGTHNEVAADDQRAAATRSAADRSIDSAEQHINAAEQHINAAAQDITAYDRDAERTSGYIRQLNEIDQIEIQPVAHAPKLIKPANPTSKRHGYTALVDDDVNLPTDPQIIDSVRNGWQEYSEGYAFHGAFSPRYNGNPLSNEIKGLELKKQAGMSQDDYERQHEIFEKVAIANARKLVSNQHKYNQDEYQERERTAMMLLDTLTNQSMPAPAKVDEQKAEAAKPARDDDFDFSL